MRETRIRKRRAATALAIGALAGAAGINVALSDGTENAPTGPDAGDLTVRQLAGQRIVAGFNGRRPPKRLKAMIRGGDLAGVILFDDNVGDRSDARRLIRALQSIRRPRHLRDPLLVMVDQEGGLVKRLPGPPTASAAAMGHRGAAFSRDQGRSTGKSLRRAAVNVDLAPVLDVGRPGSAIRDEHRSFGGTTAKVSETAIPFAQALQGGGVSATAKHFPGIGAAAVNTDIAVQEVGLSRSELRSTDEKPYQAYIDSGGDLVMLSMAIYPAFSDRPAALARPIATGELRGRLGFEGVSISDSLQTASAQAVGGPAKVGAAAARAGTDLLLFSEVGAAAKAGAALREKLRNRSLPRGEFEHSVQRVLDLRSAFG